MPVQPSSPSLASTAPRRGIGNDSSQARGVEPQGIMQAKPVSQRPAQRKAPPIGAQEEPSGNPRATQSASRRQAAHSLRPGLNNAPQILLPPVVRKQAQSVLPLHTEKSGFPASQIPGAA